MDLSSDNFLLIWPGNMYKSILQETFLNKDFLEECYAFCMTHLYFVLRKVKRAYLGLKIKTKILQDLRLSVAVFELNRKI